MRNLLMLLVMIGVTNGFRLMCVVDDQGAEGTAKRDEVTNGFRLMCVADKRSRQRRQRAINVTNGFRLMCVADG